ncbi:MAG: hypothetical protein KGS61_03365 [Verrucomicrobia bacterium]|nr:hypothetical protein [Verrucomicrobiota bacterium]
MNSLSRGRIRAAYAVAVGADLLQIGLFPLFVEGIASPLNATLDVIVGLVLTLLVGWHFAFLPTFIVELVPLVDVVPTWILAVFIATRQTRGAPAAPASTRPVPPNQSQSAAGASPVIEVESSVTRESRPGAPSR